MLFFGRHTVHDKAYRKTEIAVYLTHPLAVTLCKIVVDRDNVHALACKRVEICRKGRHHRLTFTRFHFGNSTLVKYDTAYNLHVVVAHVKYALGRFAHYGKGIG